jgi:type IV secretion system protein VirB9
MRHRQAPALYVLSNERNRKPQIVNYRVKDGYYIVDRIFQAAVLMEGTKTQRKVTILNEKLYKDYHSQDVFASNESSK